MNISGNKMKYYSDLQINIGDSVLDEWAEEHVPPKIGVVIDYIPAASAFPYVVCWNNGQQWEYDDNEILEMKAAYEKYKL